MPPEKFGEKPNRPFREIRNVSIKEFWEPDEPVPVTGPVEQIELSPEESAEIDASMREIEETERKQRERLDNLGYKPFDPQAELRDIRQLTKRQKELMPEQQRMIIKAKFGRYKDQLERYKRGIADTIKQLREQVDSRPDSSKAFLQAIVRASSSAYRFGLEAIDTFDRAIDSYSAKHEAVEKYRKLYPLDSELFQVSFGVAPEGRVKVIKGPMTLSFLCFDIKDYTLAYNFHKVGADKTKIDESLIDAARLSGGAALHSCAVPELQEVVTIVNMENSTKLESRVVTKNKAFRGGGDITVLLRSQNDMVIDIEGGGVYHLKTLVRDPKGSPERIRLTDSQGKILRDLLVSTTLKDPNYGFRNFGDGNKNKVTSREVDESFDVYDKKGTQLGWVYVGINPGFVKVESFAPTVTKVAYQVTETTEVLDEKRLKSVLDHEEQHQFNKLFTPGELRLWPHAVRAEAVHQKTAEEVIQFFIRGAVRFDRRLIGIDKAARDEILAYYRDGSSPDVIFDTLSTSTLYDYKNKEEFKKEIDKIADEVASHAKENMTDILWEDESPDAGLIDSQELALDKEDIKKSIEKVFGEEYVADLKTWISAITKLGDKGYSREEIISLFTQEPVNHWVKLAERTRTKLRGS